MTTISLSLSFKKFYEEILFFLILTSSIGCASRPVLYSNEKLKKTGTKAAKKDISQCETEADKFWNTNRKLEQSSNKKRRPSKNIGGISGALRGDNSYSIYPKQAKQERETLDMRKVKKRITIKCLVKLGYEVIDFD